MIRVQKLPANEMLFNERFHENQTQMHLNEDASHTDDTQKHYLY